MTSNVKKPKDRMLKVFFMLVIVGLLAAFSYWAQSTKLDLLTRGMGRVIAAGENKSIQSSETGTILNLNVSKGDQIEAGDIIASINPTEALGLLNELNARQSSIEIQIKRLDSEINGNPADSLKKDLDGYEVSAIAAQMALFYARRTTLDQKISSLKTEYARTLENKIEKQEELAGIRELVLILQQEKDEILPLIKKGVLGKSEKFRLDREQSRLTSQIEVLKAQLNQIEYTTESKLSEIELINNEFMESAFDERARLIAQLYETNSRIPTLQQDLKATTIVAPIAGTINDLAINSTGAFIRAGDTIAEIVPSGKDLRIQAYIDPKDIGLLEPGQPCRVALTAFDAARYGYMTGELIRIAADTTFREDSNSHMYAIEIKFKNDFLDTAGQIVEILPGMVAQVDVVRGERSILEYIWQPVAKIKDDAFRQ